MKFKSGQKVVCIATGKWTFSCKKLSFWKALFAKFSHGFGPKFNEIVTVDGYADPGYIYVKEYRLLEQEREYSFAEYAFEPLISDEQLEHELESISLTPS